jgi:hypothetical protein
MRGTILALVSSLALGGCLSNLPDHGGAGNGTGSGNGTGGADTPNGDNCGVQNFMLARGGTPDLLLVQDISGSMNQTEADGDAAATGLPSKWTEIRAAIQSVVTTTTTVDWGLMMFPSSAAGGGNACVPATPNVAIKAGNNQLIADTLTGTTPNGNTPTAAAMNSAVKYLNGLTDGSAKYIVLATDGEPNSCGSSQDDSAGAVAAVTAAAAAGINTFVVGIGTAMGAQSTLNNMAKAGKQVNPQGNGVSYYPVTSQGALETVLGTITGQIVSCSYALQAAPANPDLVSIVADGMTISRDPTHMNGWDFGPGDKSVVFYGAACTGLQGAKMIGAVYGCPPIT